jgi:N-methylhydantoinase B
MADFPGARSRKFIIRADGALEVLGSKLDHVRVNPGDQLHYITWGGGGWGDPLRREPSLVVAEIRRGLITPEGARRYGIVLDEECNLDERATREFRESLAAARGAIPIFDFGPPIEELKRDCERYTGLPPPACPRSPAPHRHLVLDCYDCERRGALEKS